MGNTVICKHGVNQRGKETSLRSPTVQDNKREKYIVSDRYISEAPFKW